MTLWRLEGCECLVQQNGKDSVVKCWSRSKKKKKAFYLWLNNNFQFPSWIIFSGFPWDGCLFCLFPSWYMFCFFPLSRWLSAAFRKLCWLASLLGFFFFFPSFPPSSFAQCVVGTTGNTKHVHLKDTSVMKIMLLSTELQKQCLLSIQNMDLMLYG